MGMESTGETPYWGANAKNLKRTKWLEFTGQHTREDSCTERELQRSVEVSLHVFNRVVSSACTWGDDSRLETDLPEHSVRTVPPTHTRLVVVPVSTTIQENIIIHLALGRIFRSGTINTRLNTALVPPNKSQNQDLKRSNCLKVTQNSIAEKMIKNI